MNQDALIPFNPTRPEDSDLYKAAERHVQHLRDRGLVTPEHELMAQLVLHLARSAAGQTKAYALANIAKELREAIGQLPGDQATDPFDALTQHLAGLSSDG